MKKFLIRMIKFYQKKISPSRPACCKFYPTCSSYTLQSLERFGVLRGSLLALYRLLRCNQFSKGGYDPVPKKFLGR